MQRTLPLVIALTLVIFAGLLHGRWTQRWEKSYAVDTAAARLGNLPMILGDWQGIPIEMSREQLSVGEIAGYTARTYTNRRTGAAVTILLVCGSPGPISVHTPDICYAGAGYELTGPPMKRTLPMASPGRPAEFMQAVFAKSTSALSTSLGIRWSWSADGTWEAPDNPRLAYAPRQALYKLYVIRELGPAGVPNEDDSSEEFFKTLLPELTWTLFRGP